MCGIVGLGRLSSLDLFEKDREVFMQLLHTGVVRGHHGTGIFAVDQNGGARVVKSAGPPYLLMVASEFNAFWAKTKAAKTQLLVGHNRFATTGQKITKHAHPFVAKHIVMVHNGSLEASSTIPDYTKYDVDSEALANSIASIGIEETLKNTVGAYAIVYWDTKTKTLNMIRNVERPLHVAIDKAINRVMFASEPEMLKWVLHRNFYDVPETDVTIKELPVNTLWTFSMNSAIPEITSILGKSRVTHIYQGYTGDYYKDQEWDPVAVQWVKKGNTYELEPDDERQRIIDLFLEGYPEHKPKQPSLPLPAPKAAVTIPLPRAGVSPRLREIFVNTKDYIQSDKRQQEGGTKTLKRGDRIEVMINDHVPENAAKQQHIIIAEHEDWPGFRFQFRVNSDGALDAMFEAVVVEITVQNFLTPKAGRPTEEVIVWANNPHIPVTAAPDTPNTHPTVH